MKKFLCMLLCLLLPLHALAAARMPDMRGNINDVADVLSAQTVADLAEFSKQVTQKARIDLHVAAVHFLDGMEPLAYAERLFHKWQLTEEDLLLVCAAGEDSFALFMGDKAAQVLDRSSADNLLYTSSEFASLFRSQRYDAAMAAFARGLNVLLEKRTGSAVRMDGLFGQNVPSVPVQLETYGTELWKDVMESINESTHERQSHFREADERENGLTAGSWIVLIILIMIMLRRNKPGRSRGRSGCGCSPIGWIVSLLGLGFLFRHK